MKRFLLGFIVAVTAMVMMATCVLADTATVNGITWTYFVKDGEAHLGYEHKPEGYGGGAPVSGCLYGSIAFDGSICYHRAVDNNKISGAVTIPSSLDGYPVTSIGDYAFFCCDYLTSVTIPNSVTSIGDYAFDGCMCLRSVEMGNSVISIGDEAFSGCRGLTNVTIPNSVTSIGDEAFYQCRYLTSVVIGNSVTNIGDYAFYNCPELTSVEMGNSIISIGDSAFRLCTSLTSITIPDSVTSIGDYAFYNCRGLGLTSVTIPNSVTSIGAYAFNGCSFTSITIGNSVTSIGDYAFQWCDVTSVTIPGSVTSIGSCAFEGCVYLESATFLGAAPRYVGYDIFNLCGVDFTIKVKKGTKGWNGDYTSTALPTTWHGYPIKYATESAYKVVFNANGGSGSMPAQTIACNTSTKLRANAFKRTGYTFLGWAKTKTGAVVYKNAAAVKNLTASGATIKLYARWAKTKYKIAYYANGGKGSMATQSMTYNKAAYLTKNAFKRTGYVFAGWAKSATGSVVYTNGKAVKNLSASGATIKLYAKWKPITYKIVFNANGGSGSMAAQAMTYNKAAYLSKNAFKRSECMFLGWAKTAKGAIAYKNAAAVKNLRSTAGTITLYARWAKTNYQIAFNANGGSGTMANQVMTYNKAAYLTKNAFKRTGYTFQGWAKTATGAVVYKNAAAVKNLSGSGATINLYAKWKPISYKIAFNANGGKGSMASKGMTYNKAAYLSKNAFTRSGYVFIGWAKSATGAVAYKNAAAVKNLRSTAGTITLYAKWAKPKYKIAFYANGGSGSMSAQAMTYNKAAYLKKNAFKRTGYTFKGWAKSPTGSVVYTNGKAVKNLTTNGGTVKLYAVWFKFEGVQLWEDGPYWAETNVGAENPWDYGYYFWWGDTIGYKWENNKWVASDGSSSNFSFEEANAPTCGKDYAAIDNEGWTICSVLAPKYDAARAHLGENWRMPTESEFDDLCDNCIWTWTTINGVEGYIVSGKGVYSDASIFLPAAGYGDGINFSLDYYKGPSDGCYWSSVARSILSPSTSFLEFDYDDLWVPMSGGRCLGYPVRPVLAYPK